MPFPKKQPLLNPRYKTDNMQNNPMPQKPKIQQNKKQLRRNNTQLPHKHKKRHAHTIPQRRIHRALPRNPQKIQTSHSAKIQAKNRKRPQKQIPYPASPQKHNQTKRTPHISGRNH